MVMLRHLVGEDGVGGVLAIHGGGGRVGVAEQRERDKGVRRGGACVRVRVGVRVRRGGAWWAEWVE
jgi:hypothetical protein